MTRGAVLLITLTLCMALATCSRDIGITATVEPPNTTQDGKLNREDGPNIIPGDPLNPDPTDNPDSTDPPQPGPTPTASYPPECKEGQHLGLWKDTNNNKIGEDSEYMGEVSAWVGPDDPDDNYGYTSASAHPITGPEPKTLAAHVFFYEQASDAGRIYLTYFFNKDNESGVNRVIYEIETSGNDGLDGVVFKDDPDARNDIIQQQSAQNGFLYQGNTNYDNNTDGGVIGPFADRNFQVIIKITNGGNLTDGRFYSASGDPISLSNPTSAFTPVIIKWVGQSVCGP